MKRTALRIEAFRVANGALQSDEENIAGFLASVVVEGEEHLLAMRDAYAVLEL